jgi:hypothetical protein
VSGSNVSLASFLAVGWRSDLLPCLMTGLQIVGAGLVPALLCNELSELWEHNSASHGTLVNGGVG